MIVIRKPAMRVLPTAGLLAALALCHGSCQGTVEVTREDVAVFRAVVLARLRNIDRGGAARKKVVILDTTLRLCDTSKWSGECMAHSVGEPIRKLAPDVWRRSRHSHPIPALDLERVIPVSAATLEKEEPYSFERNYPEAYELLKMSMPAYDNGKATIFVSQISNPMEGSAGLLHLTKKDRRWVIAKFDVLVLI